MEFFKNKTILITGHKGFLGSWLSLLLYKKCKTIYGISHKENKNNIFNLLNLNSKIRSYCFDLNDTKKLTNFFRNKKIDIVIHLAAQAIVYEAFKNQENTIKNNFLITLNLLSKTNHFRNMIFVNFTSDKVYENSNNKKKRFDENATLFGSDPYSFSKSCGDMLSKVWSENNKNSNKYINIRSGNIIGGGDWGKNRIVPDIMISIFKKKKLKIRQPHSTRPWISVFEVCKYIIELLKKNHKIRNKFSAWNIGPSKNENIKVISLIKLFKFKTEEINLKVQKYKTKIKEKKFLNLNNNKINNFLKKKYLLSVNDRIEFTYEWYKTYYLNKKKIKEKTNEQIKQYLKKIY